MINRKNCSILLARKMSIQQIKNNLTIYVAKRFWLVIQIIFGIYLLKVDLLYGSDAIGSANEYMPKQSET